MTKKEILENNIGKELCAYRISNNNIYNLTIEKINNIQYDTYSSEILTNDFQNISYFNIDDYNYFTINHIEPEKLENIKKLFKTNKELAKEILLSYKKTARQTSG